MARFNEGTVEAGGRTLSFIESGGDAAYPPLVLVHGSGGGKESWLALLRELLAHTVRGIALDLPGHGKSTGPGLQDIFSYSHVIESFVQALGLQEPVLGGHSMGGGIALACALAFPEKLGGIALIGSGARLRVLPSILEGVRTRFSSGVDEIIEYSFSHRAPSDLVAEGRKKLLACPPEVVHGDFSACNAFDQMDKVDTVRLPALIVCGEEDKLTPPKYSVYLAERIPGASLCLVPEAGHMVMVEKPREVGEAVLNFLRRL